MIGQVGFALLASVRIGGAGDRICTPARLDGKRRPSPRWTLRTVFALREIANTALDRQAGARGW
jgi:hypothetical protein